MINLCAYCLSQTSPPTSITLRSSVSSSSSATLRPFMEATPLWPSARWSSLWSSSQSSWWISTSRSKWSTGSGAWVQVYMSYSKHSTHTVMNTHMQSSTMLHLMLPSFVQDLFRAGIGALMYIITSLICVIGGSGDGARIAGGVSLAAMSWIPNVSICLQMFCCLFWQPSSSICDSVIV